MSNMPKPLPFVVKLSTELHSKLLKDLQEQGFEILHPPHSIFQGCKKGISCTLYSSGKLVVQGKEAQPFIEFYLEPELLGSFEHSYADLSIDRTPRIGVDEAGKGDFFGPLCIAGVYAGEKEIDELIKIGVKDSKSMRDSTIQKMAKQIRNAVPHHIVRISPKRYNSLYQQFGNLNLLLAWGHATVIEVLVKATGCQSALIDQFSHLPLVENALKKKGLALNFTKRTKAESDPVVAAASILARDSFVSGMDTLSEWMGFKLPKGASALVFETGKKIYLDKGEAIFDELAKKHFKTLDAILGKPRQ